MTKKNLLRLVLLLAVIGFFADKYFAGSADVRAAPRQTAAPIPTDARAFTLGTLEFNSCELTQKDTGATTPAFCAPFSVPENRNLAAPEQSGGRKIDLHLALIKSEAERADTDIVVFLAGGPGQAAIETYPQIAGALAPLRKHHHILLLDQRGTGGSNALNCKFDDEKNASENFDPAELRKHAQECLAQIAPKSDPTQYTTTAAVADLESVRAALGNPQFDLVGVSYGTRIAQQYLMRHPDGVRSVVLDSVAPNEIALGEDFAANLDYALKRQFALCIQNANCQKTFGDPYASLIKLRDSLRAQPQDYTYRDPLTFQSAQMHFTDMRLAGLVRMFAYTPLTAALLPMSIAEGLKGDYAPLAGQSKLLTGGLSDLASNMMQYSIICSEDVDLLTPRPQDADLILGSTLIDVIKGVCAVWPHGARPADFHAPLKSDKPVLVLEGELDPVTPPRYGEAVMKGLTDARLLIAKSQGHNIIGAGCIPKLVEEFVDKLQAKTLDAKCVDVLGPTPALIDFNGAAP